MGRLTIEQIIENCEKTTKQYEEKVSDLFPVERIQSKTYWEHKQVAEYLKELQRYKDLEEQGRLIEQKHGTWESLDSYVYECDGMWQCSECGEDFYFEFGTPLECRAYYCPNCGAKMDEVE